MSHSSTSVSDTGNRPADPEIASSAGGGDPEKVDAEKLELENVKQVGLQTSAGGPDGHVTVSGEVVSLTWKTWVVIFVSSGRGPDIFKFL